LKDKAKVSLASAWKITSLHAEKPSRDLLTLAARFGRFSREPYSG